MNRLFNFFAKACEGDAPGSVSSTRLITIIGSFLILFVILFVFAVASWHGRNIADIPASVGTTLGSYLLVLLGAKTAQSAIENKTPPAPPPSS